MAILTVPVLIRWHRSPLAETDASDHASAACYRRSEDVVVVPIIVAELKFSDVERHVLFADFVERTNHAAFEDRPEAFNRVCVDRANNVFASGVLDDLVPADLPDMSIAGPLVGHKQADFFGDRLANESGKHIGANRFDYACYDITLALDGANNRLLAGTDATATSAASPPMFIVGLAANKCFINFDNAKQLLEFFILQSRTNAVAHMPGGPVRTESHIALDLPSTNALLACEHQIDDTKPFAKIDLRVFEDCPDQMRESISPSFPTIRALPFEFHGRERIDAVAVTSRAAHASRPPMSNQVVVAGFLVGECCLPLADGHLVDLAWLLGAGHVVSPNRLERH
jgi:hypothetical protein